MCGAGFRDEGRGHEQRDPGKAALKARKGQELASPQGLGRDPSVSVQ